MPSSFTHLYRIRSYERRDGRKTPGQSRAYKTGWPKFGLTVSSGKLDWEITFNRIAPCILEIGFGTGQSLLALAQLQPNHNYIGIETHKPGIGSLFLGMERLGLSNIRVYEEDAVTVLEEAIPAASVDIVQIFFPDPWPKRRHHPRRLIQLSFLEILGRILKPGGQLHIATDWEDYALHIQKVFARNTLFYNVSGSDELASRSPQRPIITKFEQRGLNAGRLIYEWQFKKGSNEIKN